MYNQIDNLLNNKFYDKMLIDSKFYSKIQPFIDCASSSDVPILIMGEIGTWKPLFAKLIHNNSQRNRGKFLVANFENTNKEFLETEIFGRDYIDFSKYKVKKIGKLEQASGGSILLNEISRIPNALQSRLMQVIQDQKIHHAGGNETISIDTRIIATTSEDLHSIIKKEKFREDLYYRIAVFPIVIPPLKEFRQDIELLTKRFVRLYAKKFDKQIANISDDAMEALMNYDWPGNFCELEKAIEYAINREKSGILGNISLPEEIVENKKQINNFPFQKINIPPDKIVPLREIERQVLIHTMKITDNNVQLAAKALGINRATVYRKLDKYNLLEK